MTMKERQGYVESLRIDAVLQRLTEVLAALQETEKVRADRDAVRADAQMLLGELEVALEAKAEGKNDTERKAAYLELRGEDPVYRDQEEAVHRYQVEVTDLDLAIADLRRRFGFGQHLLSVRAAQLNFLAGAAQESRPAKA